MIIGAHIAEVVVVTNYYVLKFKYLDSSPWLGIPRSTTALPFKAPFTVLLLVSGCVIISIRCSVQLCTNTLSLLLIVSIKFSDLEQVKFSVY